MAVTYDELRPDILTALRLSANSAVNFNTELKGLFNAAVDDLKGAGADISKNETLVRQAIIFYCKANFGLEINEKWQTMYEKTRDALGSRTSDIREAEA